MADAKANPDVITITVGPDGTVNQDIYSAIFANDVHESLGSWTYKSSYLSLQPESRVGNGYVTSLMDGVEIDVSSSSYSYQYGFSPNGFSTGTQAFTSSAVVEGTSATLAGLGANQSLDITITYSFTDALYNDDSGTVQAINDGGVTKDLNDFSSNTSTITLHFVGLRSAPLLTTTSMELAATQEDAGAPFGGVGTLVSSLVGNGNVVLDPSTTLDGIALTGVNTTHGSWWYSIDDGTHWSQVGPLGVSESAALLLPANGGRLYFQPAQSFGGVVSSAITFHAWDQSTDLAGAVADLTATHATGGQTAYSTAEATGSIAVDAGPSVINGNTAMLAAIDEETANPPGDTVQNLFGSHFAGANGSVKFTGVAVSIPSISGMADGNWQYFSAGAWHDIGAMFDNNALLLTPSTLVRFLPADDFNGAAPGLVAHLVGDAGGPITTGTTADLGATGGVTPYSVDTVTLGETVNAVDYGPTASDAQAVTDVSHAHTFAATDFAFIDVTGAPEAPEPLKAITVVSTPANGALKLMLPGTFGLSVAANTTIQASDIQYLVYTPQSGFQGDDTFQFKVQEAEDTFFGARDTSAAATMTIKVKVNDAPIAVASSAVTDVSHPHRFALADFHFTDVTDAPEPLKAVIITGTPFNGTLTLDGVQLTSRTTVLAADIPNLVYTPSFGFQGTDRFFFEVQGNGGTDGGGQDTSQYPDAAMTITVKPNTAPVAVASSAVTDIDHAHSFAATEFHFTDATDAPEPLKAVIITAGPPANGTLTLNGAAAPQNTPILAADIPNLVYTPNSGFQGTDTFSFKVQDNGGTDGGGQDTSQYPDATMTITVKPNTAPVAVASSAVTDVDHAHSFAASDFHFTDACAGAAQGGDHHPASRQWHADAERSTGTA
jgi:hypothetical protein